ncbi:integrase core domain-containing protein [Brevibacterium permense]|uniref:integrase core domain-containing protein n=1 Tax=Brevibacterium permense TaxID=234834 RepID=UPI0034E2BD92
MASVGSGGDAYDNAMAEALNSVYKAELIGRKAWSGLIEVKAETSKWVAWYNQSRLHSAINYRPPVEVRSEWINQSATEPAAA